jgi:hypothetical protein
VVTPAAVLAVFAGSLRAGRVPLATRLWGRKQSPLLPWWGQMAFNFVLGVAVLAAAVVWLGRDGRMLGYAGLVLAVASSQWLLLRAWRR